ncbi:MAG: CCA tRNA nucleotidyltransferase, partial [Bdellovibrionales bacterium]|nr:CCA tRNA nucleotidyltransferase [Bdellovibrionales bacterium]
MAIAISQKGFKVYFAGGCVRDAYMGRPFNDIDIATSATPDDLIGLFEKTIDIGKAFGTIVVVTPNAQFEVTTFRKDGDYKDGRHPTGVHFSDDLEDAKRRDFTINGLFFDPISAEVIDHISGIKDI